MAFDNLCKLLSEKYPDRFAAWILGSLPVAVNVLKKNQHSNDSKFLPTRSY